MNESDYQDAWTTAPESPENTSSTGLDNIAAWLARCSLSAPLARYGRPTPNASESLPSGCVPTVTTALAPALGGLLAAGPREG